MALFDADVLLQEEESEKTFEIAGFEKDGEKYPVTLTIKSTDKIRESEKRIRRKCLDINFRRKDNSDYTETVRKNDPIGYAVEIVGLCYVSSAGDVVNKHSKEVFQALCRKVPAFAQAVASELIEFFDGAKLFKQQQEVVRSARSA